MMNRLLLLSLALSMVCPAALWGAGIEVERVNTLQLEQAPLDFARSRDGRRLFLLDQSGEVLVYTAAGKLESRLPALEGIDKPQKLALSTDGSQLYLLSSKDKSLSQIDLNYVFDIDREGSPFKGAENAPVSIVLFSEFQCPHCDSLTDLIDLLQTEYKGQLKVVFKNFPLRKHKYARHAAMAALAAHEQGKFWEMHDLLYLFQEELDQKKVQEIALEVGLDQRKYQQDIRSNKIARQLQKDLQQGQEMGVRGTPTVFINGRLLKQRNLAGFRAAIEKELEPLQSSK